MLTAGLVLLPFAVKSFRNIPLTKLSWVIISGLLGSFFPAFLFCIAETKIDSSLAGILNAFTPIFALIIGIIMYKLQVGWFKILGLALGFVGLVLLFITRGNISFSYLSYASLVLLATIFYGMNINLVAHHLKGQTSITIASVAFCSLIIPSLVVLFLAGFFHHSFTEPNIISSMAASVALGVGGTAFASILYYMLIKRAGGFFASMVTYGIPFVAVGWGLYGGESITILQVLCLCVILIGVYMASLKNTTNDKIDSMND
jgi:drug/metabolite transporter (DMT)-like permease